VDQIGDEARLADEVLLKLLDARIFFANKLDGYELMEVARTVLIGLVNDAHAAFGDLPEQLVTELVLNQFHRGHTVMEAQSATAGKCADAGLAWKLLHP
jgi:hypothetical protein